MPWVDVCSISSALSLSFFFLDSGFLVLWSHSFLFLKTSTHLYCREGSGCGSFGLTPPSQAYHTMSLSRGFACVTPWAWKACLSWPVTQHPLQSPAYPARPTQRRHLPPFHVAPAFSSLLCAPTALARVLLPCLFQHFIAIYLCERQQVPERQSAGLLHACVPSSEKAQAWHRVDRPGHVDICRRGRCCSGWILQVTEWPKVVNDHLGVRKTSQVKRLQMS